VSIKSEEKRRRALSSGTRSDGKSDSKIFDLTVELSNELSEQPILPSNLSQYERTAQEMVEGMLVNELLDSLGLCFRNCFGEAFIRKGEEGG